VPAPLPTPALYLLFNHRLTVAQDRDARQTLGVEKIVAPPDHIRRLWAQIPPEVDDPATFLAPVLQWLTDAPRRGDYLLVQGDFGATCLVVKRALLRGIIPVYSTTRREAVEHRYPDGRIELQHTFCHVRYRRYSQ
jgi:hypothetical protein